jgi:hypothetical protein
LSNPGFNAPAKQWHVGVRQPALTGSSLKNSITKGSWRFVLGWPAFVLAETAQQFKIARLRNTVFCSERQWSKRVIW